MFFVGGSVVECVLRGNRVSFLRRKEKCSCLRGNGGIFMDGIEVESAGARAEQCSSTSRSSSGGCGVCFYFQSSTVTVKVIGWSTFSNRPFMMA